MDDLLAALGLAVVLEGAVYALFPAFMQRRLADIIGQPPERIRIAGLTAAFFGILLVWLARG